MKLNKLMLVPAVLAMAGGHIQAEEKTKYFPHFRK